MTKKYNDPGGIQTYNLRNGYKNTKLGVIPVDWKIKTLGEIGTFSKGKGINKSELREQGLPCVRYAEIYTKYDNYTVTFTSFIDDEEANNSKEIQRGDLLFAGSGETLEDIGKCIAYLGEKPAYAGGDVIILRPEGQDPKFLGFMLNYKTTNRQIHKLGQGHSVVHIYSSGLKNLKIPLPALLEQQKIAQILSTWDIAIEKQEQLIAVKDTFKKGLIQILLTGKKRFEGFENEWIELTLKKIVKIIMGQSPPSNSYNQVGDGIYLIQGNTDIKKRTSSPRFWTNKPTKIIEPGDILMTVRAPVGAIAKSTHKACIGRGMCAFRPLRDVDNEFLFQWMLQFEDKWAIYAQGSTFTAVTGRDINSLVLNLPSIKEQKKIASVLSDADKEIKHLKEQLKLLKDQKQGLMQRLFTGEVRVKINKE